jgi:hypothetical protein
MRYLLVFTVVLASASVVHACPTCKGAVEVLPAGETMSGVRGGFNVSVYVLLATVLGAMGMVARTVYKSR